MSAPHDTPFFWRLRWRLRSRAWRRAPGGPAILLYHSISERSRDPLLLATPPALFARHLAWLAKHRSVLPLAVFLEKLQAGRLEARDTAITFDDGYADNLSTAAPLLAQHGMQGTVFVASRWLRQGGEGWWEQLDSLILGGHLQGRISVEGLKGLIDEPYDAAREEAWNVLQPAQNQRQLLFVAASRHARRLDPAARERLLGGLLSLLDSPLPPRAMHALANAENWKTCLADEALTLGAHTRAHSQLSALSAEDMESDIADGLNELKETLGVAPQVFAYPFGTAEDFGPREGAALKRLGFRFALANQAGHIHRGTDHFAIPRLLVQQGDEAWLAQALGETP